jgi:hypothetical protein
MAADLSITRLVGMLKEGDGQAAQRLWEADFGRLTALARAKLRGVPTRAVDEDLWKMEGYADAEIAGLLGCIRQTVGRKLRLIRDLWSEGVPS